MSVFEINIHLSYYDYNHFKLNSTNQKLRYKHKYINSHILHYYFNQP